MSSTTRPRFARRLATVAVTVATLLTSAATVTVGSATPAEAADLHSFDAYLKAREKPYSAHCWKYFEKHEKPGFVSWVRCETAKKYHDFVAVNLTGPHYDIETGRAKPGPALRDIQITTPSLFGKTEVLVKSEYNLDKDNDGTSERHELVSQTYILNGGESLAVRVPIAPNDPRCGGHDIIVIMKDLKTKRRVGETFRGLNSPEGVDINNPPPIERIG